MPLTLKQLRDAEWIEVYRYDGVAMEFSTYAARGVPHLTVTHTRRKGNKKNPVSISYMSRGRMTDSPSQAVRYWNESECKEKQRENAANHIT